MKCTGCGAENSTQESLFVCQYCGVQNVAKNYFKDKSQHSLEESHISKFKKDGLRKYNLGEYESAIQSLEDSLKIENSDDSEAWIFLALSQAQTVKPSNFLDKFRVISDAIDRAKNSVLDDELLVNSEIELSSLVIQNSADAANFYHGNSTKRFHSSGSGLEQAEQAIKILKTAFTFPNHGSNNRIIALVYGIEISAQYESRYGDFLADGKDFLDQLEKLYSSREQSQVFIQEKVIDLTSDYGQKFLKNNSKIFFQKKSKPSILNSKANPSEDEAEGSATVGCLFIIVVIGLIAYFLIS